MPRLAWFTPVPPTKSGIARYNQELLPALGAASQIDVFVDALPPDLAEVAEWARSRHRWVCEPSAETEDRAPGVLPADFSIYLHHPTVTDPSMAPAGKSTFYALVPVAHMGKLAVDWDQVGPVLEKRVLDEVGRWLIPDIHDRIVTKFHYAPRDFASDLNAHLGSAFSLEPILTQSAYFRGHNRDDVIDNFYLTGAGTHPGAGIPGVVGSAKATAGLMLQDLAE